MHTFVALKESVLMTTLMALKVKANHYPLLDSKFKFSQLGFGSQRINITLPSKVSSLQLVKLRRKNKCSKRREIALDSFSKTVTIFWWQLKG